MRLLRYVMPYWRVFAVSLISMIVVAATEPAFPALLKPMLDGSFVQKDMFLIKWVPLLLIGLFVVRGIASFISTYTINWVSSRVVMDLRQAMFNRLVDLPTRFFDHTSSGALIANVAFNVTQVTSAATSVITVLVRDTLTIAGLLTWMFYINWKLSFIALGTAPLIILLTRTVSGRLRSMSRATQKSMGTITHVLEESIECQKVVKIFGGQGYEKQRFHEAVNWNRRYSMKQLAASAASVPIVELIAAGALALIVYIATLDSASHSTTVGGFVSFITAMLMLFPPLKRLTSVNENLQRGLAAAENVFELLDETPELDSARNEIGRAEGRLEFRGVGLRYQGSDLPALKNISVDITAGETIALVGASGSGKTTLVNLIPRFYSPTEGVILLDGVDIQSLRLIDLRRNIAVVSQDVVLFNDTIAGNIAYGPLRQASNEAIEAAAEAAHAMEFIRDLPAGLHTFIGENGMRLSGGQRQRLAIARALLKDAPILILDEATSALDTASERHVQAALEGLMRNRTTIVIAHRLSTIENADRIAVLHKGEIAELGTHQMLLARNGIYAHLYQIQFAPDGKDRAPAV